MWVSVFLKAGSHILLPFLLQFQLLLVLFYTCPTNNRACSYWPSRPLLFGKLPPIIAMDHLTNSSHMKSVHHVTEEG